MKRKAQQSEVYGLTELAEKFGCSIRTLHRIINEDIPKDERPKKHGGAYIIGGERIDEFRALLLNRRIRAPWAKARGETCER